MPAKAVAIYRADGDTVLDYGPGRKCGLCGATLNRYNDGDICVRHRDVPLRPIPDFTKIETRLRALRALCGVKRGPFAHNTTIKKKVYGAIATVVISCVISQFKIDRESLLTQRDKTHTQPRYILIFSLMTDLGLPTAMVARIMGNRNVASIQAAVEIVRNSLFTNQEIHEHIHRLRVSYITPVERLLEDWNFPPDI